jgi:hypothetical protein
MLINVATPHIGSIVGMLITSLKRLFDQKCKCDPKKTRKNFQEDYENLYIGPQFLIEIRYSQIIASFYIVMIYSAGMPLLYLISMI